MSVIYNALIFFDIFEFNELWENVEISSQKVLKVIIFKGNI